MTEEHNPEQQPWTPTIEGEPLLNAFANPLSDSGEPHNPVLLEKLDAEGEESFGGGDPVATETIPPAIPVAEIKPAQ
jgi:hypothetical protein